MTSFEYVLVMVSLVIGLAITEVLTGFAKLLGEGGRVRPYWVQVLQLTFILLFAVVIWWTGWQLHDRLVWGLPMLLFFLVGPVVVYLAAHLAFPEGLEDTPLDQFYYAVAPRVYMLLLVGLIWGYVGNVALLGRSLVGGRTLLQVAAAVLLVGLASTKRRSAHAVGIIALLLTLAISVYYEGTVIAD